MIYKGNHKLGDFFTSRRERGTPGLPMLSVTMNNGVVTRESLDRKMETNLSDEEHLLVRKDDIVYNMMRMWQGASGLADRDGLLSPAYVVLAPKKGIDPLYASYLFKSSRLIYLLWAYSYGLTSDRLRLYFNDFKRIPVNIPSLPKQRKIGEILSTWDKAIECNEKLIEVSRFQYKALMQQLLTGKKRFNEFRQEKWISGKLGDYLINVIGGGTPNRQIENYWGGQIPWITVKDLVSPNIHGAQERITEQGLVASASNLIPSGTVIVATRMAVGKAVVSSCAVAINQDLKALVPSEQINPRYLHYWLMLNEESIAKLSGGSTVKGLSLSGLKNIKIQLPFSINEQELIVDCLNKESEYLSLLEQKLTILKNEKKVLMQQLLTGKRRVKVDES